MPQIIPIKDLKNTAEISDMCHKTAATNIYYEKWIWRYGYYEYGNI